MHINTRPPSPASVESLQGHSTGKMAASGTAGSATLSANPLKNQLTARSEQYLLRFKHHGSLTEKAMANAASSALEHDRFLANPAREKPVTQFGVAMNLNGCKGMLLANFTSHNDRLELEALAFREERFFEAEAGKIELVVLDRARELPEVKHHQPSAEGAERRAESTGVENHANAGASAPAGEEAAGTDQASPPEKSLSEQEIAEAKKKLDKDIKRYDSQTMQRKMASKLADNWIAEGSSKSRLTALPAAHATVAGARIHNKANQIGSWVKERAATTLQQTFGLEEKTPPAPSPAPPPPPPAVVNVPSGQQYQFSKQEFTDFHEEYWLPHRENAAKPEHTDTMLSTQPSRSASVAGAPDSPALAQSNSSSPRYTQFASQERQEELRQQPEPSSSSASTADSLAQNTQASRPASAAGAPDSPVLAQPNVLSRRQARFISQGMQEELRQQLEAGSSSASAADVLTQNTQGSRPASAAGAPDSPALAQPNALSRRQARFISQDMQDELRQQLAAGSSSASAADPLTQNRRYGADFNEQLISQLQEELNKLPSRQKE